jgi:hypothetical protein
MKNKIDLFFGGFYLFFILNWMTIVFIATSVHWVFHWKDILLVFAAGMALYLVFDHFNDFIKANRESKKK